MREVAKVEQLDSDAMSAKWQKDQSAYNFQAWSEICDRQARAAERFHELDTERIDVLRQLESLVGTQV